ncbi:HNH endonuclease [Acanthopleuribacter pedis]|uniref:HNH endonuclease n=1 Tax=Acanthopleuribacter pedis TaxID=442870 RepID=A0A8J7QB32_9BACT|nr:HNH endonuclease signature motif containing protein [Acanthopleuribacter pedis]MBO1321177.1 HNH endonuclease [Acanthopleuribacter pedis]
MDFFVSLTPEDEQKRERTKARELRKSSWWRNQLGSGRCYYCREYFSPDDLTMDHKTPIVRGGRSTKNNCVPCCKDCNNEKKYMHLGEWIQKRLEEGRPLACAKDELY